MKRFGLYSNAVSEENREYISVVEMFNIDQAEAYFAGTKKLALPDFRQLYHVKEIKQSTKRLLFGNE
jgi:hypothetical protein